MLKVATMVAWRHCRPTRESESAQATMPLPSCPEGSSSNQVEDMEIDTSKVKESYFVPCYFWRGI